MQLRGFFLRNAAISKFKLLLNYNQPLKKNKMKNISVIIMAIFTFSSAHAQLNNTKWSTTLQINGSINTMFDFKKDTALVYMVDDGSMIERMTYTSTDTSITLTKIDGQSPCDNVPGTYLFTIKENNLMMKVLKDECYDRVNVIDNTVWSKWKNAQ
jgi:hypothetical protein